MKPERLELQSADPCQINLDALYQIAPSCFTEVMSPDGKTIKRAVNFAVLRQLLGDTVADEGAELYQFTWPGKAEARREAARTTNKTLRPVKKDSVDWDTTQNLYIEGDNLEVLKLLQKSYLGKVKMIYIDPPYNTGNDFVYDDDFSKSVAEYAEASGDVDELGKRYRKNTDSNGRFHSDWCSMMYPRLQIARSLLAEDGVIFISIDDNEVENLRKICDEIFGVSNRVDRGSLIWVNKGSTKGFNRIVKNHEYIIAYAKDVETVWSAYGTNFASTLGSVEHYCYNKPSPANPTRDVIFKKGCKIESGKTITFTDHVGDEVQLKIVEGKMEFVNGVLNHDVTLRGAFPYCNQIEHFFSHLGTGVPTVDFKGQKWEEIFFNSKGLPRYRKERNNEIISSIIDSPNIPNYGSEEIKNLLGKKEIFSFPKPKELIYHLCSFFLPPNSLIIDFFSGSASTAHAVFTLNARSEGKRRFIMVQLPEETEADSEARKAGYTNICEIGKERIRRAGKKVKEEAGLNGQDLDIGFRVFRVDDSNMIDTYFHPTVYLQHQLEELISNVKVGRDNLDLLFGAMLDWGVELSLPMSTVTVDGCEIYVVNEGDLVACFAPNITKSVIERIADYSPRRVLLRDSCFASDADKINIFEQFKQSLGWSDEDTYKNIRVL